MSEVLVIQPDASDPIGAVASHLTDAGCVLRTIRPHLGEAVPHVLDADALIVLGGDMCAWDIATYPWLSDLVALLRQAVAQVRPTLAICLGAQLLALAHDGEVQPGAAGLETGVVPLYLRAPAQTDPLTSDLPASFRMIGSHRDEIVQLPPGATWLIEGSEYPHQAFRVGSAAWGVQFHPEANAATYRSWAGTMSADVETAKKFERGCIDAAEQSDEIALIADRLFESFARQVRCSRSGAPAQNGSVDASVKGSVALSSVRSDLANTTRKALSSDSE